MQPAPRGVLFPQRLGKDVQLEHHPPSAALAPWVVRFWIGRWELAAPYAQPLIPHPCVNLEVVRVPGMPIHAEISGVKSHRVVKQLRGRGMTSAR